MNSYNKGQETVLIKHPISKIKNIADAIFTSQEYVKKILIDRQIAIETCPSSNLRISQMETLDNHSIFKWQPPGNQTGLHALIATDNRAHSKKGGIFLSPERAQYTSPGQRPG